MKLVLGLDIGISSVGWGILDENTGNIVDAGVRLFEEATRNANEDRRKFRGSRRLKRRRIHRLERARQLMDSINFPVSAIGQEDPYLSRYNAIFGTVSKEQLVCALYHLVKRRGTTLDSLEEEKLNGNELSTKEQLSRNKKLLENKYICEIQLDRLANKNEKMRNHENRFRTSDYVKEARAILNKQKQVYPEITEEFIKNYIELIEQRRQYFEGPGSRKSPTPYGSFFIDSEGKLQEISMINKMRGKCTYFSDQYRIAKMSFTADLFNLLSGDLNKLLINGEYLTYEDKVYLVENFVKKGKNITLPQILKYKGLSDDADVTGYRQDLKTGKPLFTEFKGYKALLKVVIDHKLPEEILDNYDLLDEIVEILTAEKSYQRREEQLQKIFINYDEETVSKMVDAFKENTIFSGYHALSKKAITSIIEELWHSNKNQMQLFSELGLEQLRLSSVKEQKQITFDDDAILSTVAKRAHREAIKIVNEVRNKYGELSAVVVETAREKNSEEKRKQYTDFQKKEGNFEKEMSKLLGVASLADLHLKSKQRLALKLWHSQDGKCIYSGKSISVHDIVTDHSLFEVDHILPISLSFDDSQSNKVLCYYSENQNKGQKTPFQYFLSGKSSRTFEQFKVEVLNLYKSRKITNKKKEYLLELRDIQNNEELQKEFINRNLVDTQYAMRSFSMTLRTFFKEHNINTNVISIRGSFTAALRRRARLNKDRDESHAHHAIDALIVAAIGRMPIFEFFKEFRMNELGVIVDKETCEILEEDQFFEGKYINFIRSLMNYESKIKYSHKVDRKANRSMSNQTLYGTRKKDNEIYCLGKVSNIYQLNKNTVAPLLKRLEKKPDDFLMAKYNPDIFSLIQKIVKEYSSADNPFKAYYEEHGYIMKDGKVPVKTLRYYDSKLGVHMNITEHYPNAKNEVVVLSVKSVRIDLYKNKEGKYKYLGVPYHWFKQQGNYYILDINKYNEEKRQPHKNIDDSYEFQFSLYKNDLFSYEKDGEYHERIFRGDNNPRQNKIEVEYVYRKKQQKERAQGLLAPSTFKNVIKYNTDVLGNKYKISKEDFKSYLQL
ncbi:type II CRISPR RNA-guided endonuclease Cas9 [Bacillus sp. V3-13]|uniref:type II CRISPR RNA-guided endonuclease Cas9 n=1 Tax=Bacillus sp. V3-13 TaxID=2053728 RepID=UPI000C782C01|nr:type II CRISPR RNA-guided endonuclease Cas9 [Bacillus sp. V3-13]PLR75183.1 type II CRISPR RNA-guided endonuclease Cas9 [Bacillus sp. V3-13]